MKSLIEVTVFNGQFYYELFYFLAIFLAATLFMIDGYRKKYPLPEWSFIFSCGFVFLIIGSKIFTYTPQDWCEIIQTWKIPYTEKNTILGGIIGGIVGLWLSKKIIRFNFPVLDSFAIGLPIGMAIQRIGCFLVGCCYGIPTNVPWSVSYSNHTHVFYEHVNDGLVGLSSNMSHPVHPNQLYQTILCLIITLIVWKLRNKFKKPGNLFFTSVTLYLVARFIVEFWRDSKSYGIIGYEWLGLKYLQWALIIAVLTFSIFIYAREKQYSDETKRGVNNRMPIWYLIALALLILIIRNWFAKVALLCIELVVLFTIMVQINYFIRIKSKNLQLKLISVYSLFFIFLFIGSLAAQKSYKELTSDSTSRNVFNDFYLGYRQLEYSHYHKAPTIGQGCDGQTHYYPSGPVYDHVSNVFGMGFSRINTYGCFQKSTFNGSFSIGWDKELDTLNQNRIVLFDFSPSIKYDFRWFGVGLGIHAGQGVNEVWENGYYYSLEYSSQEYFSLSYNIRILPYDIFYIEWRTNENFPYLSGQRSLVNNMEILIGSGIGLKNGSFVEFGVGGEGFFVSTNFMLKNKYGFRGSCYYNPNPEFETIQMFNFSLLYRFAKDPSKREKEDL
jgi:prolipoprotein diacylglyceryltransferase